MTNTRIKDTLYEDAHLDKRGMKDIGLRGKGKGKQRRHTAIAAHLAYFFIFFCFFACAPSKPEADDNCSAYPLPVQPARARDRHTGTHRKGHINLGACTFILITHTQSLTHTHTHTHKGVGQFIYVPASFDVLLLF